MTLTRRPDVAPCFTRRVRGPVRKHTDGSGPCAFVALVLDSSSHFWSVHGLPRYRWDVLRRRSSRPIQVPPHFIRGWRPRKVRPSRPDAAGDQPTGGSPASPAQDGLAGSTNAAATTLDANDSERQLSLVMRNVQKGDIDSAVQILDRLLAVEPLNRAALMGRSALALDQSRSGEVGGGSSAVGRQSARSDANASQRPTRRQSPTSSSSSARCST